MDDVAQILDELDRVVAGATPAPWQTRFMFRMFRAARAYRDVPHAIEFNTPPEADWPDAEFIVTARDTFPALLACVRALVKMPTVHRPDCERWRVCGDPMGSVTMTPGQPAEVNARPWRCFCGVGARDAALAQLAAVGTRTP